MGPAVAIAQHQSGALILVEAGEHVAHLGRPRRIPFPAHRLDLDRLVGAQLVEAAAPGDPRQPGAIGRAPVELARRAPRLEKGVLRDIVGMVHADHVRQEGPQRRFMLLDEQAERQCIARRGAPGKREILVMPHCRPDACE